MNVAIVVAIGVFGLGIGLWLWLKSRLPRDVKQEDLDRHLELYDTTDLDADERNLKELRRDRYLDLVKNYYNMTTDLLHLVWGPHYSTGILFPTEDGKWQSYAACQQMYQCYLALSLGANETMTIGDFGCGTGGPTRTIAQFTGARIKAVNINEGHLAQMKKWNEQAGIDHQIELVCSDYHETPIDSESLDGVYMCESLAHSPDYERLCREVFRVLKPGGKFTGFNWEMTERFDPENPEHRRVRHLIEYGLGVCRMVKMSDLTEALKRAGFEIVTQRDHNDFGIGLGGKRWYYFFEETSRVRRVLYSTFSLLSWERWLALAEKLRLVSPGTARAYNDVMSALGEGMIEGARQGIFTPMHYWLARKPL